MVSHKDLFYSTRQSVAVSNTNPVNNPNTELNSVPDKAEIRFEGGSDRYIDCDEFEAPNGYGFETARFLISRAMLDPDATVIPA